VHDKKITEISISGRDRPQGMRIVIELKRDAIPKVVLNKLYKHTVDAGDVRRQCWSQLVDNVPRTLRLLSVIHNYVQHQREVIVRRSKHELRTLEAQVHRLAGLLIALDHLDAVIELIRASRDRDTARNGLMESFALTRIQAQAILELRLQQLTALEADSIKREHDDKVERIRELRELLGDEGAVLELIKEELSEIRERYGDDRRTLISPSEDDLDIEDLIPDQQMVISITSTSYIKSLPLATYRQQRRGGVGRLRHGAQGRGLHRAPLHHLDARLPLFFTNRGKVYRSKVYELPEAPRTSKGRYLGNVLPLREGERVQSVLSTRTSRRAATSCSRRAGGLIKKTEFLLYNTPIKATASSRSTSATTTSSWPVRRVSDGDHIIMVAARGRRDLRGGPGRAMGRDTSGVRGMNVDHPDNALLAMDVARPDQELLVVTENGYGKRTSIADYPVKGRGSMGVKTIQLTEARGALAGALVVREHEELLFISRLGMVQRISVRGINRYGRGSQGVRLMNLREDDVVSAVALVVEEAEVPSGEGVAVAIDPGPVVEDDDTGTDDDVLDVPELATTGSPGSSTRTPDPFAEDRDAGALAPVPAVRYSG
jgi:DNA gyrase subunit A